MLVINEELFYQHYYNINAMCEQRVLDYVNQQTQENTKKTKKYKELLSSHNELLVYNKQRTQRNKLAKETEPTEE